MLENTINQDLKTAMLAKDEKALRALRAIKAAILVARTAEGAGGALKPEDEIRMLQKMVKQRRDSVDIFRQQNRTDLEQKELEEIEVIERYLPKQLSAGELEPMIRSIVAELGASGPQDMGKVMGVASRQLAGKAEGKLISEVVKKVLAG